LTWNLYHGRSVEPAGRSLLNEFAAALAGWEWDVALLQEVPPWWPPLLARACGAEARAVLTSRNWLLGVRRVVSSRNPDILKANGGGANALLVRGPIAAHAAARLCRLPERRWAHGVRLGDGSWVVNLHGSNPDGSADCLRALAAARAWAADAPLLLGGDLNVMRPALPGMTWIAGHEVDHFFSDGRPGRDAAVLEHGGLSDHAPVAVSL
jgi:endonuclease/exonuclease/phosphatase family metal-dependent hydrolase